MLVLEKSREMMNRTSVADLVKDESMTSVKAVITYMEDDRTRDKDRIEQEKNRRMSYSQENKIQSTRMDSDRRLQDFSAQKERQELPKLDVSDSAKRSDRVITTNDRVMPRHDSHEKMDSYTKSNRSRSAIDAIDSLFPDSMTTLGQHSFSVVDSVGPTLETDWPNVILLMGPPLGQHDGLTLGQRMTYCANYIDSTLDQRFFSSWPNVS